MEHFLAAFGEADRPRKDGQACQWVTQLVV